MRRRNRPRVTWLPNDLNNRLGVAPVAASSPIDSSTFIIASTGPALGVAPDVQIIPLVKDDNTDDVASAQATLSDLENSGYRLRRIVGKIQVFCAQNTAADAADPTMFVVTAGIIVLKCSDGVTPNIAAAAINPATLQTAEDPWIWRRQWVLSDEVGGQALGRNLFAPRSNIETYGAGSMDGPHVDQKTARVINQDERLFLVISVAGADGSAQAPNPGLLLTLGELRYLATMRTTVGNRRNASR